MDYLRTYLRPSLFIFFCFRAFRHTFKSKISIYITNHDRDLIAELKIQRLIEEGGGRWVLSILVQL